jgi:hypothetical protein
LLFKNVLCEYGGIGRRPRLKILCPCGVPVRVRLLAPFFLVAFAYYINSLIHLRIQKQKEKYMKTITTIAAIAALTTLAACGTAEAPAEVTATEAVATEVGASADDRVEATAPEAEKTGGPCGDGTVLAENEKCK